MTFPTEGINKLLKTWGNIAVIKAAISKIDGTIIDSVGRPTVMRVFLLKKEMATFGKELDEYSGYV